MKMAGVNRVLVRICPLGQARVSGHDTFTKKKKNKQMKSKQKELNKHLKTDSDSPIGSDRKGVLHFAFVLMPLGDSCQCQG